MSIRPSEHSLQWKSRKGILLVKHGGSRGITVSRRLLMRVSQKSSNDILKRCRFIRRDCVRTVSKDLQLSSRNPLGNFAGVIRSTNPIVSSSDHQRRADNPAQFFCKVEGPKKPAEANIELFIITKADRKSTRLNSSH